MKLILLILALALCVGGFGCEMHPVLKQPGNNDEKAQKASTEPQKSLQPDNPNPNPPQFFPTPKSG
jgi:hypothetical protein